MQGIHNQLFCLLIFMLTGIVIGFLFDIFRVLRKSFKTADWITYIQDILFWLLAGGIILFSIFTFNNGEIRSYVFIGIMLGIIIYILLISRFFVKTSVSVINFLKKILSFPIHLIKKITKIIIIKPILYFTKNIKQIIQKSNMKIHNFTKSNYNHEKKHKKIKEKAGILYKM